MTYQYPDYKSLKFDRPADRILRITMERGKMNEMDFEFHHSIAEVWRHVEEDPDTSVAILTGSGRAFSAGGDFALEQKVIEEFDWKARMWKDGRNLVLNMLNFPNRLSLPSTAQQPAAALPLPCCPMSQSWRDRRNLPTVMSGWVSRQGIMPPLSGRCYAVWPALNII